MQMLVMLRGTLRLLDPAGLPDGVGDVEPWAGHAELERRHQEWFEQATMYKLNDGLGAAVVGG